MSNLICHNCGSKEIELYEASGASVCTACGVIVEENTIVNSVEFIEGAGGTSKISGHFISQDRSKAYSATGLGYGFSRDSRETTLANGKKRIQDVAARVRLGEEYISKAYKFFTLAVEQNFVQGRKTEHVVVSCLYAACRMEKTNQHMLIDFSDALQVNVYVLGTCFLKFRRKLSLPLQVIDPALYIYRFAAHLDLDEKANDVSLTALRLVARMKRDWMVVGRRPAGICAAALLIAMRAHGFTKQTQDVTKVLRVCGMTVSSRLKEFEATPAANLTLEQFTKETDDMIEVEADPPVFTRNRIREARAVAIQENNVELLESGMLDDPKLSAGRKRKWRNVSALTKKQKETSQMYDDIEKELVGGHSDDDDDDENDDDYVDDEDDKKPAASELQLMEVNKSTTCSIPYPKGNNGKALVLPNQATSEELEKSTQKEEDKFSVAEFKQDMPKESMDEIDNLFRSDDEMKQKEAIFNEMNKDYLEKQAQKESDRLAAEAAAAELEKDDEAQAEGQARYLNKTRKYLNKRSKGDQNSVTFDTTTTQEALIATLQSRKISRKINYDAMSAIFDDTGSFATEHLEDNLGQDDLFGSAETIL